MAGQSVEDVSKRTQYAKTFRNPDGSFTKQISATPKHFRSGTGWAAIDNGLVADPAGGFRNRANSFIARFQSSGVRVEAAEGTVTMTPTGRSLPVPTVDPAAQTVTYPDVWGPGVDLRYQVENTGIKEEIVFGRRPAISEFPFNVDGVSLSSQADGSLAAGGSFAGKWGVDAPMVFGKDGAPLPGAAPRFSVVGNTVRLAVDGAWLASLNDATDFPVVVDPSFTSRGSPRSAAYLRNSYDDGYTTCDPCQVAVGNINAPGWRTWRATAYFPYEDLYGKQILSAQVNLGDMREGTATGYAVKVYGGDTVGYGGDWNWINLGQYLGQNTAGTSWSFNGSSLASFYQDLANRRLPGVPLKFVGDETGGIYSYKRFFSFDVTLEYNDGPSMASPSSPANGVWLHSTDSSSLTPTLWVNPASDPNGDPVAYKFVVATGTDAETGVVDLCDWQFSTGCQVGPLNWNTTYYWHVYTADYDVNRGILQWQTNPNWVWSFRPSESAPSIASVVTPPSPANTATPHTLTPTLQASATDSDGDAIEYYFRVCTGSDAESGGCLNSGWIGQSSWPVPAGLSWNTTYYWHVYTRDVGLYWQTNPNWVWSFRPTNGAPASPAPLSPAAGAVLAQTNLSFSAGSVTDPDGDPVKYQFQVATGTDGQSGRLAVSQWLSTPSWTPPAGTFADGGSYSWVVRAQDDKGDPVSSISAWSSARPVKVDFRLGQKPTLPYDTQGPASVNLSNGNLVVSVAGPSYPTVGGPVGVSFTYNSQAPALRGLTGDYYQDLNANSILDAGEPRLLHRIDPQLSFEWGSPGEGPNSAVLNPERWIGRWTGAIRVPAGQDGNWVFVTDRVDDTLTVVIAGNTTPPALSSGITTVAVHGNPVALSSASSTPIDVTYVQATGPEFLRLKIRKAADPDSAAFEIPSDWLTPTQPSLPDGWSRSGDGFAQTAYTTLRPVNGSTTAVVDASGADHLYSSSGSGWKPPAGENGILTQRADGSWSLLGDDGYLYRFTVEGRLTDITSPADDLHPGAPTYSYTTPNPGGPTRLTRITDATGRKVDLTYGPSTSCPTASGFDSSAPTDMLCKVGYTDFGAGATELYYSNGHLARVVNYTSDPGAANPKGETIDFGYNADGLITQVRDVLTNDLIAAGVFSDPSADRHKWLISYDTDPTPTRRKVVSVQGPAADAAMADSARPLRSYVYTPASGLPTQTDVQVAGGNGPAGYARRLSFDSDGHTLTELGSDGVAVDTVWDTLNDRATRKIDHHYQPDPAGGLVTTYFYDPAGRLTDTYGPAPLAEFNQQTWQSATAPHSSSGYDEAINGLAAAWFDNNDQATTPKAHTTLVPDVDWANGSPAAGIPADNFSGRLTGEVTLAAAAPLTLDADGARVVVDDQTLLDTWSANTYPEIIKGDAPTGYWNLDETSGTTAANAMGGTGATITGTVTLGQAGATGDGRTAYSFNGGSLTLPGGFVDFSQGIAIEAWANPTTNGSWERLVDIGNGPAADNILFARRGTSNDLTFQVFRGSTVVTDVNAPGAILNGSWHHYMVTMSPTGTVTIYRDGQAIQTGTGQLPNALWRSSAYIGKSNWSADPNFTGRLDDVAVYPHATLPGRAAAHVAAATGTIPSLTTTAVAAGTHRIRVDYQERTGAARLHLTATGATFKPRYNLLTTATDADGRVVKHEYLPEIGLETATVADPTGANLRTTTGYEAAGSGYYRRTSRTLPAGNATTYGYYGQGTNPTTADNPCPGGATGINQGGALWKTTEPDPDGAGPATARVQESIYDAAGRPIASRIGTEAWTCLTYDHRGRVLTKTIPAFDAGPARTATYNYAATDPGLGISNPAITTAGDAAGTITTKVDWLGRVIAYTDVWGDTTTTSYDQAGRITDTAGPGGTFHTDYDPAGRPSTQKLDGAVVATATYDPTSGLLTATNYPTGTGNAGNGTSSTLSRDTRGRLAGLTWKKPDGTTLTSDTVTRSSGGKVTDETVDGADPNPAGANFAYDGASRLTDGWAPGHHYTYSFAATGGCGSQANAGLNTNRTATTDNGGAAMTYCYDAADRLTSTSDPRYGGISYDAHGNTKTLGGQALGYDAVDRHLTTGYGTTAAPTTITYARDATERITARTLSAPGTVSFRAAAGANNAGGSTSLTITRPTGTQTGDVLLAQVTTAAATATVTAPAGWTLQNSTADTGNNVRDLLYWRVAAANDPTSWNWTFSSSLKASGGITVYSGVDPASPINAAAVTTNGTATNLVAPSVITTKDNTMVVATYGTRTGTTITAASGMSERYDQASTGNAAASRTTSETADQTQATAGTTGTRTAVAAASVTASVNRTIALTPAPIVTPTRYGYSGGGDSPDLTLDTSNNLVERTFTLLGDVLLTKRSAGAVWSYPNIHGDIVVTADGAGTKTAGTFSYDPYGQALTAVPDNSAGNFDYGWIGQHQRPLEHEGTLATIEMGDRQYVPGLGRFIEVDPVEGGSANNYEYAAGDPVNNFDLDGNRLPCFSCAARHVKNAVGTASKTVLNHVVVVGSINFGPISARGGVSLAGGKLSIGFGGSFSLKPNDWFRAMTKWPNLPIPTASVTANYTSGAPRSGVGPVATICGELLCGSVSRNGVTGGNSFGIGVGTPGVSIRQGGMNWWNLG